MYPTAPHRPLGVTLLAIIEILGGLAQLVLGFGFLTIATLLSLVDIRSRVGDAVPQWVLDNVTVFFGVVGVLFLVMAIIALVLAWAFLKGKSWSRTAAIVLLVISIVVGLVGALGGVSLITVAFSIVLPSILVAYLSTSGVKQWFTA
jgi:hypothetical protein